MSNAGWYARKLGLPQNLPTRQEPGPQNTNPVPTYNRQPAQQAPQPPAENLKGMADALAKGDQAGGARTQALRNAPTCPSCGSEHFLAEPMAGKAPSCFSCGYNGGRFDLSAN